MKAMLKRCVVEVTPPILSRVARSLLRPSPGEREPEWYDKAYKPHSDYHEHYTKSRYYFLWTVLADRIVHAGVHSILDMGCGPGQLARLLYDKGLKRYCGIDFSPTCIAQAKRTCPNFDFIEADIFETDLMEMYDYDTVLAMEFLEHVERDTEILTRVKPGAKFYGSVPNFPDPAHVRYFTDESEVYSRYQSYFAEFRADTFLADTDGTRTYYLMEGTKS